MVYFICNACGETLKRNKVELHYTTKCRRCEVLSCVDCNKEFVGDDYKLHMTCISEEEKYSGSNYIAKANKGEVKQELWQKSILEAVEKYKNNSMLKDLLTRLIQHPNVPRKQKKFENFMRSSFGVRDTKCIGQIWEVISQNESTTNKNVGTTELSNGTNGKETNNNTSTENTQNGDSEKKLNKREKKEQRKLLQDKKQKKDKNKESEVEENSNLKKCKKKRKRKHNDSDEDDNDDDDDDDGNTMTNNKKVKLGEEEMEEEEEEEEESPIKKRKIKFNWEKVIEEILKSKGEEIPIKKLRKKVLAEYANQGGGLESEDSICAKFNKKVTKNPKFKVFKERVKLAKAR